MSRRRRKNPPRRQRAAPPPLDPQQRYDMHEAAAYLRKSRSTLFEDIKAGSLRTIKEGGRTYIPGSEIQRLSSLPSR